MILTSPLICRLAAEIVTATHPVLLSKMVWGVIEQMTGQLCADGIDLAPIRWACRYDFLCDEYVIGASDPSACVAAFRSAIEEVL